jgi:hypothetical protein
MYFRRNIHNSLLQDLLISAKDKRPNAVVLTCFPHHKILENATGLSIAGFALQRTELDLRSRTAFAVDHFYSKFGQFHSNGLLLLPGKSWEHGEGENL